MNTVYYYAAFKGWQSYRFDEARRLYDKALNMMQPDSAMMYKIYGGYALGYYQSGDFEKALKYYKLSYEQNPSFVSAIKVIGYCYEKLEKFAEAQKWYRRYLGVLPVDVEEREWTEGKIEEMEGEIFMHK